jgi:hypothetical protein
MRRITIANMAQNKEEIAAKFNKIIYSLLNRVERKSRCEDDVANLDILQRRISQYKRAMGPEALIEVAAPIILDYAQPILDCNDSFFTSMDMRAEVIAKGGIINDNDEYIFMLIESVKKHYAKIKDDERRQIFADVNTLLSCSAEYVSL